MSSTDEDLNLTHKYQKKTDKQHILDNPNIYTGSMEETTSKLYVLNEKSDRIVLRSMTWIPGLVKLCDEAFVNCHDHAVRTATPPDDIDASNTHFPVTTIEITIREDGTIVFYNDGNGIDVVKHPEHKTWIPEMIFAHLRTGTNYDKSVKTIVGGQNGFGSKLIFIWSTTGELETVDFNRGLKFVQTYSDNLDVISKPIITKCNKKPYTKITFKPDYQRLGMSGITSDIIDIFKKRAYDIAAVTNKKIKVKLNGCLIPVRTFADYIDMYIGLKLETKRVYETSHERWEYAISLSQSDEFSQISFVNGIHTSRGGKHVEYLMNQIIRKLIAYIEKKKKITVKPLTLRDQMMLFLRCDIENPSFESQTKDFMSSPSTKFGSSCVVSDAFIEKIAKLGIMDKAVDLTTFKENKVHAKKTDGSKSKSIRGIPKLVDANFAGTAKSQLCTLILCEGDSAKAGVISGLSKEDRNIFGVYPMKGKLFNVRGETTKRISENKEITEIKQIMGLETKKEYKTIEDVKKNLRYNKIIFMTDQDLDGSHIKGLIVNMFDSQWVSLLKLNLLGFMNTPIIKAWKGKHEKLFYNEGQYQEWKETDTKGWVIKYYKGLGTSTGKEFKEYFKDKKFVMFSYDEQDGNAIDMVFNKKRVPERKQWLINYDPTKCLNTDIQNVSCKQFLNEEMIHFSRYDCARSIGNVMDGFKISQRKVYFGVFKKNLSKEIKVAQLSGYISEHTCYHHGEASLNGTIIGMAQDFVGSNNIPLLLPKGQFGTRHQGGKDSASERYIFTQENPVTKLIFNENDKDVLTYLEDDGTSIEPKFYAPIIPMILVNGCRGIGTGFSTNVMCYNPIDLIQFVKSLLVGDTSPSIPINPYYNGFIGKIIKTSPNKYIIKGVYTKTDKNTIIVSELPIGTWTTDYKEYLEKEMDSSNKYIKDINDMSTDKNVCFTIKFNSGIIDKLESVVIDKNTNGLEKMLGLTTPYSTSNMHLYDANDILKKYKSVEDIIKDYYATRLKLYGDRIIHIMAILNSELFILSNKARYITENLEGTIDLRHKKKQEITDILVSKKYDMDNDDDFKYLIKMPMDSVSVENVSKILNQKKLKEIELTKYTNMKPETLWLDELNSLESMLKKK